MRITYGRRLLRRTGKGIKDATLRLGVEQRLRLVLSMQVHEQARRPIFGRMLAGINQ